MHEQREDEISLKEIIHTVWDGKWIITVVTVVAMLAAAIFSFWMIAPTYEATSTVKLNHESRQTFIEQLKSDAVINEAIEDLKLDRTISSVRGSTTITNIEETNLITITVKGTEPAETKNIANYLAYSFVQNIEISDRLNEIVDSRTKLRAIDNQLEKTEAEISQIENRLSETPEKRTTYKTLADEMYLQYNLANSGEIDSELLNELMLSEEHINSNYTRLEGELADAEKRLTALQSDQNAFNGIIEENEAIIDELENADMSEVTSTRDIMRMTNGYTAAIVTPAYEPTVPVAPNKLLNVAIAIVVGLMVGVMIVFVRHMMKDEPDRYTRHSKSVTPSV